MPNLSIKDVPETLTEMLRQRAHRNHRSLQGELMAIISAAVTETPPGTQNNVLSVADAHTGAAPAPSRAAGTRKGTKTIEQVWAEIRQRAPRPQGGSPLAVDIIRKMRDER